MATASGSSGSSGSSGGAQWTLRIAIHGRRRETAQAAAHRKSLEQPPDLAEQSRAVVATGLADTALCKIAKEAFEARKTPLKGDGKATRCRAPGASCATQIRPGSGPADQPARHPRRHGADLPRHGRHRAQDDEPDRPPPARPAGRGRRCPSRHSEKHAHACRGTSVERTYRRWISSCSACAGPIVSRAATGGGEDQRRKRTVDWREAQYPEFLQQVASSQAGSCDPERPTHQTAAALRRVAPLQADLIRNRVLNRYVSSLKSEFLMNY
jgi:hypothetical protein